MIRGKSNFLSENLLSEEQGRRRPEPPAAGLQEPALDLEQVSYVDSAGLGELVQAYVTARKRDGSLKLLNVTKRLRDLLVVTRLLTVFETFDSEEEAIASFGGATL